VLKKSYNLLPCFLIPVILIFSCRSINRSNEELGIKPSIVIFSFDDGPNAYFDTTAKLLDILGKYEIKALFALLGENVEKSPDLVRRISNEGHVIINHGYSGKWARKMGEGEFRNNLIMGEAAISAALGREFYPKLYRPHGGYYSRKHEKICIEEGYTFISSSVRVYDAVLTEAKKEKAVRQVLEKIEKQNGGIILLHDGRDSQARMGEKLKKNPHSAFNRSWFPEAVEEIILALLERGYNLNSSSYYLFNYIFEYQ